MNEQFFDCLKRERDIRIKPKLRKNGLQVEPHLKQTTTTATKTAPKKRFNKQNNIMGDKSLLNFGAKFV